MLPTLPNPFSRATHPLSLSRSIPSPFTTKTMHQAIPAGMCHLPPPTTVEHGEPNGVDPANVIRMVSENPVIVFGRRGCCMCHVVQRLLQGLGVNPPLYEVDEGYEAAVAGELSRKITGCGGDGPGKVQFPAVFVGGKLFGGLDRVMATHISGELVPILKDAGALWL